MTKPEIRIEYKKRFSKITGDMHEKLFNNVINSDEFKNCSNILMFYGSALEPKTKDIIEFALKQGKKVALPFCTKEQGVMYFYEIISLAQLKIGAYNIMEPDPLTCNKANIAEYNICFVPGIFDVKGNRTGHGKGYYDRFLVNFKEIKAGLTFSCLLFDNIDAEEHDIPMDILFTDKGKTIIKR